MSHRVAFSPEALDQLASLKDYIAAKADTRTALHYVDSIVAFCEKLKTYPQRGTSREDLLPGLRTLGFKRRVTIAFTVGDEVVKIVGVFYGGQDIAGRLRLN
jgi:plasmid stabilization system protein ParE